MTWKQLRERFSAPRKVQDARILHSKYKDVFGTPNGQDVLFDICKSAYVFRDAFVAGDSHQTAHREGARNLALQILSAVDKDFGEIQRLNETTTDS